MALLSQVAGKTGVRRPAAIGEWREREFNVERPISVGLAGVPLGGRFMLAHLLTWLTVLEVLVLLLLLLLLPLALWAKSESRFLAACARDKL